jgi:hypothetical protein
MGILSNVGENTGVGAVKELHKTADDAIDKVTHEVVPALGDTVKGVEDYGINGLVGLLAQLRNTLNGATVPLHWELRVGGQVVATFDGTIGPVRLTVPDEMPSQVVEVQG